MTDETNEVATPATAPPIIAPASANTQALLNLARQILAVVALLIALLGLGETSVVVKIYRIASNDQLLSLVAGAVGTGLVAWSAFKAKRRAVQVQTLVALPMVPDSIGHLSAPITPSVQAAVDAAMETTQARYTPNPVRYTSGI